MKYYLLLLVTALSFADNLSGPVNALPDSSGNATANCVWNGTQTHKACIKTENALSGDQDLTIKFGELDFSGSFWAGALHTVNNDLDDIGTTSARYRYLFANNWYNYSANAMAMVSNTTQIIIDTLASQPIQFYTGNTYRGQFDSSGNFNVASLSGAGYRNVCTDASGNIVVSGSCPSAGTTNSHLVTSCANFLTLSGSYQNTGCTVTITATGYWLFVATLDTTVIYATGVAASGQMAIFVNGSLPSSTDIGIIALSSGTNGETIVVTPSHSWIYNVSSGDVVAMYAAGSGSASSIYGNLTAVYLHP